MSKELSDFLDKLAINCTFVTTSCSSTPTTLLSKVINHAPRNMQWTIYHGMLLGETDFLQELDSKKIKLKTWHVSQPIRKFLESGQAEYLPIKASDLTQFLKSVVDIALIRVSKPNNNGYCSLGPSTSWTKEVISQAKFVIAEMDESLPWTEGDSVIPISKLSVILTSTTEVPIHKTRDSNQNDKIIADYVLSLIPANPTLQFGLGSVTESIARSIDTESFGRTTFVGMGSDGMINLIDAQSKTGRQNSTVLFAVELLGSKDLMKFAHKNQSIEMINSDKCHNPSWLAGFPRFVSVNSAIEVDLSGQVASESARGNPISGIGGSVDFFEGAHQSIGGISIIAMSSLSADLNQSKIVAHLGQDTPVTIPRFMVDYVVTEFGIAKLFGKSLKERAEALISVSSPKFHHELSNSL